MAVNLEQFAVNSRDSSLSLGAFNAFKRRLKTCLFSRGQWRTPSGAAATFCDLGAVYFQNYLLTYLTDAHEHTQLSRHTRFYTYGDSDNAFRPRAQLTSKCRRRSLCGDENSICYFVWHIVRAIDCSCVDCILLFSIVAVYCGFHSCQNSSTAGSIACIRLRLPCFGRITNNKAKLSLE